MAINKKLIHFNEKSEFDKRLANDEILDTSIVFVKDSKEIWTHGNLYKSVNWSVLEKPKTLITFSIQSEKYSPEFRTYTAEAGMTWGEFLNSDYDKESPCSSNRNLAIKSFGNYTDVVMAYDTDYSPYIVKDNSNNIQYKTDVLINNMSYKYTGEK